MQQLLADIVLCLHFVEQRPWSEWGRTNESCVQHTGHDNEQVQESYLMCEQPLIDYCYHRIKEHSNSVSKPSLSPMNLLVVTLWYLMHYHAERDMATEFDLSSSTVYHVLSKVVDILHSCVYPALVFLPSDIANRNAIHEPEEHHKLIVDSTATAIP
ncbi:unnamed protein product [Rotaria sp. Silwood1]|nr:unnamed protein product [Rotaria sp. Silwood1]CAF1684564.1 unnamed protein product [Rotaria sp. Silwood1]CAF3816133.1 unnamed protein product [Rotaria sp. Silwood1]CAF3845096.1 unnamed protein product [Rotaria sp. Silwood1]CAF3938358.1 unnamed protein product [Rotaria sp. Silwood1]